MQSNCGSARTRCCTCAESWTSSAMRPMTTPRAGRPSSACTSYFLSSSTRSDRMCSAAQHVVQLTAQQEHSSPATSDPLMKGRGLLYAHCRLRKAHIAQWRGRHRDATVLLTTLQSLTYRRAHLLRRPPLCARRDGQPRGYIGGHRARRSRLGDL